MLDAFIIEQIKRRERRDDRPQPRLERPGSMPWGPPDWAPEAERREREDRIRDDRGRGDRDEEYNGIVILDM